MSWKYRPDETDVLYGDGVPTSVVVRPTIYIDRSTGTSWVNLGGGSTWSVGARLTTGTYETVTTTPRVITSADDGLVFFLAKADGIAFTLPANATVGFRCTFIVKTAPTTICTITAATADTIAGWPINTGGADGSGDGNAAGDVLNFAANVALPADRADFVSDGTTWHVRATSKVINAITITG